MTQIFTDDFNYTDGSDMDGVNNWHQSGAVWEANNTHKVWLRAASAFDFLTNSTSLSTADYEVESLMTVPTNGGSHGITWRYVDFGNMYFARASGTLVLDLYKEVSSSFTQLGTTSVSWTTNVLRGGGQGTTQRVYMDGVQQISQSDSAFSAEGDFGLHTGVTVDFDRSIFDYCYVYDFGGGQDTPELRGHPYGARGQAQMQQLLSQ